MLRENADIVDSAAARLVDRDQANDARVNYTARAGETMGI